MLKFGLKSIKHSKITVIVPTRNSAGDISTTLKSLSQQDFENIQILVIDQASSDLTCELVHEHSLFDKRFTLLKQVQDFGAGYAINEALLKADGEYLVFLTPGTYLPPDNLSLSLEFLVRNQLQMLIAELPQNNSNKESSGKIDFKHSTDSLIVFHGKSTLEKIGFLDCVRVGSLVEYYLRAESFFGQDKVSAGEIKRAYWGLLGSRNTIKIGKGGLANFSKKQLKTSSEPEILKPYLKSFENWHQATNPKELFVSFPPVRRPFPLKKKNNNWRPSSNKNFLTAILMPINLEAEELPSAISSILPQVDSLHVYIPPTQKVPDFLQHPKIEIKNIQGHDEGIEFGNLDLLCSNSSGYHFVIDGRFTYPRDYAAQTIMAIEKYDRKVIVGRQEGVSKAPRPLNKNHRSRQKNPSADCDRFVSQISISTIAFHTDILKTHAAGLPFPQPPDFPKVLEYKKNGVPLVCLREVEQKDDEENNLFPGSFKQNDKESYLGNQLLEKLAPSDPDIRDSQRIFNKMTEFDASTASIDKDFVKAYFSYHQLNFALIINGWNCEDEVEECINSVYTQIPDYFVMKVYVIDDGSTDNTYEVLLRLQGKYEFQLFRNLTNKGAAYSRWQLIKKVEDQDSIVVLLDLDDKLKSYALRVVAEKYRDNPDCFLTYGNWEDQYGEKNPLSFYSKKIKKEKAYRTEPHFKCGHLRTFRRSLAENLNDADFKDQDGRWLKYCTDVALMLPLLELCNPKNIIEIQEVVYIYKRNRSTSTLKRFGKSNKNEILQQILDRPPKATKSTASEDPRQFNSFR